MANSSTIITWNKAWWVADKPAALHGDSPLRKIGVSADGQDSQYRLPAPCLHPSHRSGAPAGRSVAAPFTTGLGSSAAAHAGPAKLVLHALGKNDSLSLQAAPIIKAGRGFHACPNLPLSKCLHTQHGRARASRSIPGCSVAQLGVQPLPGHSPVPSSVASLLCSCLPCLLCCFFLQPSHPPSLEALASLCKREQSVQSMARGQPHIPLR